MSDLQCAAEIVVARHGGGGYDGAQPHRLAESLRSRRVALIYTGPEPDAVHSAEIASGVLGVPVRVSDDLVPPAETESDRQAVERASAGLESVADLHRGETVLVIMHGGVMSLVLPYLVVNLSSDGAAARGVADTTSVELRADSDGWVRVPE